MNMVWFIILAAMLTTYAVLDGFDLGVGSLLLPLCRSEEDRGRAIASIGPVWNGNEVWLIAGGGAMFAAFPRLYAASFSGFYLALMLVLWLLILRGVSLEVREQFNQPLWRDFWDSAFSIASLLLALLFGVAVGNVLRGVPLDQTHVFAGSFAIMLNPFAVLGGVLGVCILCLHGAAYLAWRLDGSLQQRAHRLVRPLWAVGLVVIILFVVASFPARPGFGDNFLMYPVLLLIPALLVAAVVATPLLSRAGQHGRTFVATSLTIIGLLGSAAAGLYPRVLPSLSGAGNDLTVFNSATTHEGLVTALVANLIGMSIVTAYTVWIYRVWMRRSDPGVHVSVSGK